MKHENPHKLNFACLECVKKHLEHKERLMDFLHDLINTDFNIQRVDIDFALFQLNAKELLSEIKAEEGG